MRSSPLTGQDGSRSAIRQALSQSRLRDGKAPAARRASIADSLADLGAPFGGGLLPSSGKDNDDSGGSFDKGKRRASTGNFFHKSFEFGRGSLHEVSEFDKSHLQQGIFNKKSLQQQSSFSNHPNSPSEGQRSVWARRNTIASGYPSGALLHAHTPPVVDHTVANEIRAGLRRKSTLLAEEAEVLQLRLLKHTHQRRASLVDARRGSLLVPRYPPPDAGIIAHAEPPEKYDENDFVPENETVLLPDGGCYSGDFICKVEGDTRLILRHGQGTYLYPKPEQNSYVGWWEFDKQHGEGRIKYHDGSSFQGQFENGAQIFGELKRADGTMYMGDFKDGTFHGQGEITWADGSSYVGGFVRGRRESDDGEYVYKNGDVYQGMWKGGLQHGRGVLVTRKGHKYEGAWQSGKKHGKGVFSYARGEVYEGDFVHGHRHGKGRISDPKGGYYEGEWSHDQRHGKGVMRALEYTEDASRPEDAFYTYDGDWERGMKHGQGALVHGTGETYSGSWWMDLKEGQGTFVGQKFSYSGSWKQGKRHGKGEYTTRDGWKYVGDWDRGVQEGMGTAESPSGSIYTGEWSQGKAHGSGKMVHKGMHGHGDVTWVGKWKQGKRVGSIKVESDDFLFFIEYDQSKVKMKKKDVEHAIHRSDISNPLHCLGNPFRNHTETSKSSAENPFLQANSQEDVIGS